MPGDTVFVAIAVFWGGCAQRRPGVYARRHPFGAFGHRQPHDRSTKAGSLCPATQAPYSPHRNELSTAQRRPGVYARRHRRHGQQPAPQDVRSTKAGSLCPATPAPPALHTAQAPFAQRRPGVYARRHRRVDAVVAQQILRSTKAGSLCPATPSSGRGRRAADPPLNEGREFMPGDTAIFPQRTKMPSTIRTNGTIATDPDHLGILIGRERPDPTFHTAKVQ